MKKTTMYVIFGVCVLLFIICGLVVIFNFDALQYRPFQQTTSFVAPSMAKFERDGNLYVIDNGSFRLISMMPDGNIRYTINIDRFGEYTRIADAAIDDAGNLYLYVIEGEYGSMLTRRDVIRVHDNRGRFVREILSITHDDVPYGPFCNPRLFFQFGSFRYNNGILTFSQTKHDRVILYEYDRFRSELRQSVFYEGVHNFLVAQLVLKDMQNFAFVQRDGDIFEVINGGSPQLRASFNWCIYEGGIHPWHIFYNTPKGGECDNNLVFFDMGSNALFRISGSIEDVNDLERIVPERYFQPLRDRGEMTALKGFGFYGNTFAGVYGSVVWLYDGENFTTFYGELLLPLGERLRIAFTQITLVAGILAFIAGLCIMFIGILGRFVSLFIKLTVVAIPLMVVAFIIVFSVTFNTMNDQLNEALFNEIMSKAVLAAKLVDGDEVDRITSIRDFHSEEYKRLSMLVREIVGFNADPWNRAFYAAIYKGPRFQYVVVISSEEWNLFRPDWPIDEEDMEAFLSGEPIADILELHTGTWAFAMAPVFNSAGVVTSKFEVGFSMTGYELGNANLRRDVAFITAAVCVIILFALSFLISVIVKRLSFVGSVLETIARGDHTARVPYVTRDELGKVSFGLNHMAEELQHQFDRINRLNESTLRFVPLQFMEHLGVSDITKMNLGDSIQREISVLFFDIRYFSINSEMMTARENFVFINEVLGIAGPIIRKHNGFVDKFIGDAAMALFTNGMDAVRAGIELYKTLVNNKETQVKTGVDGITIGVGIHTGSVMMGIVGENERLSSTVISDNVNLASRIESLSKQTGSGLLITKDTFNQLAGNEAEFAYRFIGMVQAAGVNEVVGLFDMLDALPARTRKIRLATKKVFESGVRKYHMKDYSAAVQRFEKIVAVDPSDICASRHLEEAHRRLKYPNLPSVFTFDRRK